ncbi:hypothetical protein F511_27953 [Dorcoceras hygrometricum]|uniref:Uncharacterized protein n=1 Tax=Dorcoceras hygrometricum TaxID=472368 RepID=A0A2Z7CJG7_9LAMI|nr:hypothetical protein F511_27953 [Dorcoceras hygrometricum]
MKSGKQVSLVDRQSGPRPEARFLCQPALEGLTRSARTETPRNGDRNKSDQRAAAAAGGDVGLWRRGGGRERALGFSTCVTLNGSGIQLAVGPQPFWLRNHNFGFPQRIMVKRLATSRHDPLGITDSACKNQLVVVSIQYGPFNTYIPIRSTTIGKSRVARDLIAMHTSWRSNSDIASVTREHCDVLSMQMDSDLVIYRTTLVQTFQVPPPHLLFPSPSDVASRVARRRPRTAVPCYRICSDRRAEEISFVPNSSVLLVQAEEGFVLPIVDLIRRSTSAYLLKCRFPCEIGRSQAPRRQQGNNQ